MRYPLLVCCLLFILTNLHAEYPHEEFSSSAVKHFRIYIISGNQQSITESEIPEPLRIRLVDASSKPVSKASVEFSVIAPAQNTGNVRFNNTIAITDSSGYATIKVYRVNEAGQYQIMADCHEEIQCVPQVFTLEVRDKKWMLFMIIGLLGGLSLFLYGMFLMSEGIRNSAGDHLRYILERLTHNRFIAFFVGTILTLFTQSSSATNVMLVSFVNSKLIRFRQTIGIMLGAGIGTTITVQIIAFRLSDYSLILVALGLIFFLTSAKAKQKEIGKTILGFGLLFYGMYVMSGAMSPLRTYPPFIHVMLSFEKPVLGILVGTVFTALIQSSAAFIGILIILSTQGLLSIEAAIALIIGANLGTVITAALASIKGSREGRQVALAQTIYKATGALIFVFLIPEFIRLIEFLSPPSFEHTTLHMNTLANPRQIANAHTIYNIILCIIFLPVTNKFAALIQFILPLKPEKDLPFKLKYIDLHLLNTPSVALNAARKELVRMMKKVYHMTEIILIPFLERDITKLKLLQDTEPEINFLRDNIVNFLINTTRNNITAENARESFIMMNAVKEFEQIADILSDHLKVKAEHWCAHDFEFSEGGREELIAYHQHTLGILKKAILVYEQFDIKEAKDLKAQYNEYRKEYFELEWQHYDRLKENNEDTVASSKTHLEIITMLRIISSHATDTARILIHQTKKSKKINRK